MLKMITAATFSELSVHFFAMMGQKLIAGGSAPFENGSDHGKLFITTQSTSVLWGRS